MAKYMKGCMLTPRSAAALVQHLFTGKQDYTTIPAFMLSEHSVLPFAVSECHDVGKGFT